MRLGYACINTSIGCTSNSTIRVASYSTEKISQKIESNINCLERILKFNKDNKFLHFRIGSGLIPLATHPVNKFDWKSKYAKRLREVGNLASKCKIRLSMHPGQYTVLNSFNPSVVEKSIKELDYHCSVLDLMGQKRDAKVQLHIGGVYGNKKDAIKRFVKTFKSLKKKTRNRLVIENDHVSYSLKDCLEVNTKTKVPIVFDVYHHQCLNKGESIRDSLLRVKKTWGKIDGPMMIDYSEQGKKKGSHSKTISPYKLKAFLKRVEGIDFDLMLEVKDKEKSAVKAQKLIKNMS